VALPSACRVVNVSSQTSANGRGKPTTLLVGGCHVDFASRPPRLTSPYNARVGESNQVCYRLSPSYNSKTEGSGSSRKFDDSDLCRTVTTRQRRVIDSEDGIWLTQRIRGCSRYIACFRPVTTPQGSIFLYPEFEEVHNGTRGT